MQKIFRAKVSHCIFLAFLIALLFAPAASFALRWPVSPGGTPFNPAITKLPDMIKYLYEWAVALGGLAAFVMLLAAGLQWLTSTGDPGKIKEARSRIASAIGGLVLLLSSVLILNVINPELTNLRTPPLEPPSSPELSLDQLSAIPYTGSCSEVKVWENKDFRGGATIAKVVQEGSIKESAATHIVNIQRGSLKFFYGANPLKEGGLCTIEIYSGTTCEGEAMAMIPISYKSYNDLSPFNIKKATRCMIVRGAGADEMIQSSSLSP